MLCTSPVFYNLTSPIDTRRKNITPFRQSFHSSKILTWKAGELTRTLSLQTFTHMHKIRIAPNDKINSYLH